MTDVWDLNDGSCRLTFLIAISECIRYVLLMISFVVSRNYKKINKKPKPIPENLNFYPASRSIDNLTIFHTVILLPLLTSLSVNGLIQPLILTGRMK